MKTEGKELLPLARQEKKEIEVYLKGQRGKRKYVDYSIAHETIYNDIEPYLRDDDWDHKGVFYDKISVYTRDLRREKLYNFFKYLKDRRVFVRKLLEIR